MAHGDPCWAYGAFVVTREQLANCIVIAAATGALGMLGAWAFNPNDGAVTDSEVLWRVFGLAAYASVLVLVVACLLLVVMWALRPRSPRP